MAFDERLAARVRTVLDARSDVADKRMFGGVAFFVGGNMACGVSGEELMVRVGPDQAADLVASETAARPMEMKGRPMRGWVLVAADATADDGDLERWVRRGGGVAGRPPPHTGSGGGG